MSTATLPVAPPAIAAPVPAAAPAAESPESAPPAGTAPAPLSTASLTAALKAQFTGAPNKPTSDAGPTPSPAADSPPDNAAPAPAPTPGPTPPAPDEDDEPAPPHGQLPPEAMAAVAAARKAKREAKAQAKALAEENAALKQQLASRPGAPAPDPKAPANPPPAPAPLATVSSPELAAAEAIVAQQTELRNWSRQGGRLLQQVLEEGGDPAPVLAQLQEDLKPAGVKLPADPKQAAAWLDKVQTDAADKLDEARIDVRYQRDRAAQQAAAQRSEGETFAREIACPKMFEAGTEENRRFELIKQRLPGVEQSGDGLRFIAAAVLGWDIIKGKIEGKAGGKAAGGTATATLPAPPAAKLPGAPATVPQRPQEGEETSASLFKKYQAVLANPQATEQEREMAKQRWVKAGVAGRN